MENLNMNAAIIMVLVLVFAGGSKLTHGQYYRPSSTRCFNPNQSPGTCVSVRDCQTIISVLQRTPLQAIDREFVKASECFGGYGVGPYVCCTADTGYTRPARTARDNSNYGGYDTDDYDYGDSDGYYWGVQPSPTSSLPPHRSSTFLFPTDDRYRPSDYDRSGDNGRRGVTKLTPSPFGSIPSSGAASLPTTPVCGGVTIENKIYGGNDANLNEFPWMVQLEYNRASGVTSINCAGSLINERYVLTAAHCVKGRIEKQIGRLTTIRLGEHNGNSNVQTPQTLRVGVEETIIHDLYKDASPNKEHDIALIRLDRSIRYSDSVRPVCLPSVITSDIAQFRSADTQLTVAGWGRTLRSAKSPIKQKLQVGLVDQEQCRRRFRERKVNIVDTQICAGGKFAEDSCEGDSGGPLMHFRDGAWVLEGIVSFGYKCGLKDWPAVYTRVANYDQWIRSNLRA